ncbi:hypothetical protein NXY56_005499 [Leishmania guyanensis]
MQFSSHSSSTTSLQDPLCGSALPMRSMMGPYTMSDEGATHPPAMMGAAVGSVTAPSAFASSFYGDGSCAHSYQSATSLSEGSGRGTSWPQGTSLAEKLYQCAGSTSAGGFSHIALYDYPTATQRAVYDDSIAAVTFTESHVGPARRTNSTATSGTALSDCHLSRKDNGGFTLASARTFVKSYDSFDDRSKNSLPSLHDSLTVATSAMSCSVRESVHPHYYLDTTFQRSECDHSRVTRSEDAAIVLSAAQRRLSDSTHLTSYGAASCLSVESSFSMTRRPVGSGRSNTSLQPLHTPPHHQLPEFSTSQNGNHLAPCWRGGIEGDSYDIPVNASSASESFENGLGPTGCPPFYGIDTVAGEDNKSGRSCSAVVSRDDMTPTTTAPWRNGIRHLCSVRLRPASERRDTSDTRRPASASSPNSIATSTASRRFSLLPKAMSNAFTESKETTFSRGSVDTSRPFICHPPQSAPRKPRRKDPRKPNHSRSTSIAAPPSEEDVAPSSASSSLPVTPMTSTMVCKEKTTATLFTEAPHATLTMEGVGGGRASVRSQSPEPLRQQWDAANASNAPMSTFTVTPPSRLERHPPRPLLLRRYVERQLKPLSAREVQMATVPFSPHQAVAPSCNTTNDPATQASLKIAVPPLSPQHGQTTVLDTAQVWSPSATASSSTSFSVTPEKFITVTSGATARRMQQRLAGFAAFHLSSGVEGPGVATENPNEKSLRSLGGRSGMELRLLGESSNGIMSRSCPSVDNSADEGTNAFLIQRSSSWSVHSARSTTDTGEVTSAARKKRQAERMLPIAHELEEEYVTMHPQSSKQCLLKMPSLHKETCANEA